jgi:hypothetical protein
MNNTDTTIYFYDIFEGTNIDDVKETAKNNGMTARYVDEKIDDYLEDEDDYLIMESYDMTKGDKTFYVRLYYPQSTGEISDVYVQ